MKTKNEKFDLVAGERIQDLRTAKSWYDQDCIYGTLKTGTLIRIPVGVVMQMADDFIFKMRKAKKYHVLTDPVNIETMNEQEKSEIADLFSPDSKRGDI